MRCDLNERVFVKVESDSFPGFLGENRLDFVGYRVLDLVICILFRYSLEQSLNGDFDLLDMKLISLTICSMFMSLCLASSL